MKTIQLNGQALPVANIFCIGRNYHEHIRELDNAVPTEPVVFLKPTSALLAAGEDIVLPAFSNDVHYECELVVYIGRDAHNISAAEALAHVGGYAIGLDLTARDVQSAAKVQGLPWTQAKGFRGAACVSAFVAAAAVGNIQAQAFSLSVNGQIRQQGDSAQMILPVAQQIAYLSAVYGLQAGDLIYTGTPAGVGKMVAGDELHLRWPQQVEATFRVR